MKIDFYILANEIFDLAFKIRSKLNDEGVPLGFVGFFSYISEILENILNSYNPKDIGKITFVWEKDKDKWRKGYLDLPDSGQKFQSSFYLGKIGVDEEYYREQLKIAFVLTKYLPVRSVLVKGGRGLDYVIKQNGRKDVYGVLRWNLNLLSEQTFVHLLVGKQIHTFSQPVYKGVHIKNLNLINSVAGYKSLGIKGVKGFTFDGFVDFLIKKLNFDVTKPILIKEFEKRLQLDFADKHLENKRKRLVEEFFLIKRGISFFNFVDEKISVKELYDNSHFIGNKYQILLNFKKYGYNKLSDFDQMFKNFKILFFAKK